MKLTIIILIIFVIVAMLLFKLFRCRKKTNLNPTPAVKCTNGCFVGTYENDTGVLSYKGIPYALPPVGDLRWKAPVPAPTSDKTVNCDEFGKSAIQYRWFSEPITTDISEDCLTLNVWTDDLQTKNKPVMVWFHGGSFAWGGSSEDIYNGQYIVNEHKDVIIVTVNYRIGMMGFIDFSGVEGGEAYSDSKELGLLDSIEALKWIKKNISGFGGDPGNVTIFGESAGGGIVSDLLASDYAGDLFHRVIAQSGSVFFTYNDEAYEASPMTDALLKISGAETMADLLALPEKKLIKYNKKKLDAEYNTINDLYNLPHRGGKVLSSDVYGAISNAAKKGVDLLIGTTANEQNYWINEMWLKPLWKLSARKIMRNLANFDKYVLGDRYEQFAKECTVEERASMEAFIALNRTQGERYARSQLFTEILFHQPAIRMAEAHSKSGTAKTYMYLYGKSNTSNEHLGACHSAELPYVFHNFNNEKTYGTIDRTLADNICEAWVNFAKNGNPSSPAAQWEEYNSDTRLTMLIGDDCSLKNISDPVKEARELLQWCCDKNISFAGI